MSTEPKASSKADIVLSDGRALTIDLYKVTRREFAQMARGELTALQDDEILGRTVGLTAEQIGQLPQPDWRRLAAKLFEKAREPLADPN